MTLDSQLNLNDKYDVRPDSKYNYIKFYHTFVSVYPLFVLKSLHTDHIDVLKYPQGYITDYRGYYPMKDRNSTEDRSLILYNLPYNATVTFDIEFIYLISSQNSQFKIEARRVIAAILDRNQSVTQEVITYHSRSDAPELITIQYMRRKHIDGELVRLKYTGMFSIFKFPEKFLDFFNGNFGK